MLSILSGPNFVVWGLVKKIGFCVTAMKTKLLNLEHMKCMLQDKSA